MSIPSLNHYIRTYENALSADFCAQVVEHFESEPDKQKRNGKAFRAGLSESSWLERDFTGLQAFNFSNVITNCLRQYKGIYEKDCGIRPALPNPSALAPLIVKRYDAGGEDRFQPHFDSLADVADRYMVFLWYLNDVDEGGETSFVDLGIDASPKAGKLLIFPPYWMYRHAGKPPLSGPKYILSTYPLW